MKETAKPLSKTQKVISIATILGLAIYSVVSIALVSNAYAKLDSNVEELGDIVNNWQSGAILDLQVATSCPTGYQSALNDRAWGGIMAGCYCNSAISQATKDAKNITCSPFCSGTCSSDAKGIGCTDISSQSAQTLNYYGRNTGTNTNLQICVKRSEQTWANTATMSTGSTCPSGYKNCTAAGDNMFCVKTSDSCPITSITITKGILSVGAVATCQSAGNCAVLHNDGTANSKKIEWTTTELNQLPLAEFSLNEYDMCKLKGTSNVTPGRKYFYLYNDKTSTCYSEGASRWTESDTIKEDDLFKANYLTSSPATSLYTYVTSTLSSYTETGMSGYYATSSSGSDFTYGLFTRSYIPFKATCRDRLANFIAKKSFVDGVKNAQLALLCISIISVIFLGLPLAFMEIQNLRGVDLPCIDGKGEEERKRIKKIKKIIGYLFKGFQLPFQLWAIVYCGSSKNLLLDISDESCSNDETNAVLIFIANTLDKTYTSTLTAIGILVASILVDIILDVVDRRKTKKEAEKKKAAISPGKEEHIQLANIEEGSVSPLKFNQKSPTKPTPQPQIQVQTQPQAQPQPQAPLQFQGQPQPQTQAPLQFQGQPQQGPNIVIQLQGNNMPQQQFPQQQQGYPPQQQQFPQQGYPQQQYPPQQYPQQGYPQQQQQYPPRY